MDAEATARVAWEESDEFARWNQQGGSWTSPWSIERAQDGSTRYTMLETVRQYAQEQLNESGGAMPARTRHLAFTRSPGKPTRARGVQPGRMARRLSGGQETGSRRRHGATRRRVAARRVYA
jgi:hypothetical protein